MENVDFDSLLGEHTLDAVDYSTTQIPTWSDGFEDAQCITFRIDGTTYMAIEDPSDGYRSSMEKLMIVHDAEMKNVFSPVRVVATHRTQGSGYSSADILQFIDIANGKMIMEIGTDNDDDYYPSFVASFNPENMAANS